MTSADDRRAIHGAEYAERFERKQSPRRLERLLSRVRLAPTDRVADFGCGNGLLLPHVAPFVREYVGVDFSEPFIEAANRRKAELGVSNASFVCGDITDFCREHPRWFDVAFAMDLSEHVYDEEWLEILEAIRGALTSNGVFQIHTPNANFFVEKMKARGFLLRQFAEHVAVRSPSENARLLRAAGFSRVDVELLPHYNVLRFLHPLAAVPLVGRSFAARIFITAS